MFQQSNDSSFEVDTGEITGVNVVTTSPGLSFCTDRQYSTNIDSEYIDTNSDFIFEKKVSTA